MTHSDQIKHLSPAPIKSRGSSNNPDNRFSKQHIEKVTNDLTCAGAGSNESADAVNADDPFAPPKHPATRYIPLQCRSIVSSNQSPDVPFTYSINPYQGCEHGCIYCYARPTHEYLEHSLGLDFETKIYCKTNAVEQLQRYLDRPGYECQPIAIGANTDPYQPSEKEHCITRGILELLLRSRHPVSIITKGSLILRDLPILEALAKQGLVKVMVSVTGLDVKLKNILEPRAASPHTRIKIVRELRRKGIPVGVLIAPVIPAINDHELESVVAACAEAGAENAGYVLLRLPYQIKDLFETWLEQHYPERKNKVLNILRNSRNGGLYGSCFGERMTGTGKFSELLSQRFRLICNKHSLSKERDSLLRTNLFIRPSEADQMDLFV